MQTHTSLHLILISSILCACAACGGDVAFGGGDDDPDQGSMQGSDDLGGMTSPDLDMSPGPRDLGRADLFMAPDMMRDMRVVDMGSPLPEDMAAEDMAPPVEDMQAPVDMNPPDGPPPSPSVDDVLNQGCTTMVVRGLSEQLIEEMNCIDPGVVSSFAYLQNLNLYAAVFPFLQTPAVDALDATVSGQNTLTISSALRSVPQQYLLYRWYQQGRCNISLAASPGRSNHNGAKALDTPDYTAWKSRFQSNEWTWLGGNDPVHFTFNGGKDIRALSVLAFQKLWNRNNPNDTIAEDGDYGSNTEARLKQSPSNGFAIPPWCPSSRQYRERERLISPTLRILAWHPEHITLETYASSVVDTIIYATGEAEVTQPRQREAHANFQVTLPAGDDSMAITPFRLTTLDAQGAELRTTHGVLPGSHRIAMTPEGAGVYRVQHFAPPDRGHHMMLEVDGKHVELDPTSMQSGDPFDLLLSLRPYRDDMMARRVVVIIKDVWGARMERIEFDLMITH